MIKVGDRVDVKFAPSERWQSKKGFYNGIVKIVTEKTITVFKDSLSKDIAYHNTTAGGCYYIGSNWEITLTSKIQSL